MNFKATPIIIIGKDFRPIQSQCLPPKSSREDRRQDWGRLYTNMILSYTHLLTKKGSICCNGQANFDLISKREPINEILKQLNCELYLPWASDKLYFL